MKDNDVIRMAVCPLCGRAYHGAPALSRRTTKRSSVRTAEQDRHSSPSAWSRLSRSRFLRRSTGIWEDRLVENYTIFLYNKDVLIETNRKLAVR